MKLRAMHLLLVSVPLVFGLGCAPAGPQQAATGVGVAGSQRGILVRSRPAADSTSETPLNKIDLWFDPPARLGEVTLTGPDGMMPMMVTAVGEVDHYSIPVSVTDPGEYLLSWKASAGGQAHSGSFRFRLR